MIFYDVLYLVLCVYFSCMRISGMDIINDTLETAVNSKDKNEWTPVSVNVAPATLTILSKQVTDNKLNMTWTHVGWYSDFM